jgi:hypothetical protein
MRRCRPVSNTSRIVERHKHSLVPLLPVSAGCSSSVHRVDDQATQRAAVNTHHLSARGQVGVGIRDRASSAHHRESSCLMNQTGSRPVSPGDAEWPADSRYICRLDGSAALGVGPQQPDSRGLTRRPKPASLLTRPHLGGAGLTRLLGRDGSCRGLNRPHAGFEGEVVIGTERQSVASVVASALLLCA